MHHYDRPSTSRPRILVTIIQLNLLLSLKLAGLVLTMSAITIPQHGWTNSADQRLPYHVSAPNIFYGDPETSASQFRSAVSLQRNKSLLEYQVKISGSRTIQPKLDVRTLEFQQMTVTKNPDFKKSMGVQSHLCGATAISDRHLITAAHCLLSSRKETSYHSPLTVALLHFPRVLAGVVDLRKKQTFDGMEKAVHRISRMAIHPDYLKSNLLLISTVENVDIAILEISEGKLDLPPSVPIQIIQVEQNWARDTYFNDQEAHPMPATIMAGWGLNEHEQVNALLHSIEFQPGEVSAKDFPNSYVAKAAKERQKTWYGDSGSGLYIFHAKDKVLGPLVGVSSQVARSGGGFSLIDKMTAHWLNCQLKINATIYDPDSMPYECPEEPNNYHQPYKKLWFDNEI